ALEGLERTRLPFLDRPGWLDVVMGVEKHGGRTFGSGPLPEHGRVSAVQFEELNVFQPLVAEKGGDVLRRGSDRRLVESGRAHRRVADQFLQEGAQPREVVADGRAEIVVHVEDAKATPEPCRLARSASGATKMEE